MARNPKLKVFCTAIGFHDAYVAAPSRKAALEAWGAKSDLFARGVAEVVTDAKLSEAALAAPGEVIKVSRGTPAEQLAALGRTVKSLSTATANTNAKPAKKPSPRPSRATLDAAEAAAATLEERHRREADALDREEGELRKHRAALRQHQDRERVAVEQKRDTARAAYDRALAKWRDA